MSACEIDRFTCTLSACVLCVRCSSRVATDSRDLDKHTHTHIFVSHLFANEEINMLRWNGACEDSIICSFFIQNGIYSSLISLLAATRNCNRH